jgi:hypothetical protein
MPLIIRKRKRFFIDILSFLVQGRLGWILSFRHKVEPAIETIRTKVTAV